MLIMIICENFCDDFCTILSGIEILLCKALKIGSVFLYFWQRNNDE